MAIVVAVRPGHPNASPLGLAGELADALNEPVVAVAIVVVPPGVPSPLREGMEDDDYFALVAEAAMREAREVLGERLTATLAVGARSVRAGLLEELERRRATHLVLGSAERGEAGRTRIGDVASGLLHATQVPVHIAPVGYARAFAEHPLRRVTVAFGPGDGSRQALEFGARLADQIDSMLRAITFFVRENNSASLYSAQGYGSQISKAWHEQMAKTVDDAIRGTADLGLASRFITTEFGDGPTWRAAIDAIEWAPGEILVVGSRPRGGPIRTFLGSRAVEILHHAPVPVTVLPG